MSGQLDIPTLVSIAGYVAGIVGGVLYARSKVPGQTILTYKDLTEAQEKRIKALEDQSKIDHQNHIDNIRAIADLQGQIKVYKELPLQDMALAMQKISDTNEKISATNQVILDTLQNDARLLVTEKAGKSVVDRRKKEATITTTISK